MFQVSVIICSHNPREDYLRRVLNALKAQTLQQKDWELLLVDNSCPGQNHVESRIRLVEKGGVCSYPGIGAVEIF